MEWGARLKAAWHGDVPDVDLRAMFAATESLTRLRQSLEDRRLAATLDAAGAEWRGVLAVGRIAAPLWLGDALVGLAGTFYDDEKQGQPEHAESVSGYTHDLVAALLAPVEDIAADVAAALADPAHRTALIAPAHVGPGRQIAQGGLPEPISARYARSLATGVRRIHTSAAVTLAATQAEIATSPAPDWLTVGLRRLSGELDAAGARLDMAEVRLAPLVALAGERGGGSDPVALMAICREMWTVADSAIVVGQEASDPHLLREAPSGTSSSEAAQVVSPAHYTSPAPQTPWQRPAPLPRIAEGAPGPHTPPDAAPPEKEQGGVALSRGSALPAIGESGTGGAASDSVPPSVAKTTHTDVMLPTIGDPGHLQEGAPALPRGAAHQESQNAPHTQGTRTSEAEQRKDDPSPVRFPEIG